MGLRRRGVSPTLCRAVARQPDLCFSPPPPPVTAPACAARTPTQQHQRNDMKKMIMLSIAGLVLAPELCRAQSIPSPAVPVRTLTRMDEAKRKDWLARWHHSICGEARGYRTCDREVGEGIAWGMTPIMDGFYYGYIATKDTKYVDLWVDWTDSLLKRAVKEPDGYLGWPGKDPVGRDGQGAIPGPRGEVVQGAKEPDDVSKRRHIQDLELLAAGGSLGLQSRRKDHQTLGGCPSQRRVLR